MAPQPSFLLAVRPPAGLSERIERFRRTYEMRDAAAVPHVTVKARSGLAPDLAWVAEARTVVARTPPVAVRIGGARLFGNGTALYLAVRSPEAVRLHVALLAALKPARRFGYEGPQMTPHLSLALARRGVNLAELLLAAQAEFADLDAQPLTFTAPTVTLMKKPGPGGFYAPVEEWPLEGELGGGGYGEGGAAPVS